MFQGQSIKRTFFSLIAFSFCVSCGGGSAGGSGSQSVQKGVFYTSESSPSDFSPTQSSQRQKMILPDREIMVVKESSVARENSQFSFKGRVEGSEHGVVIASGNSSSLYAKVTTDDNSYLIRPDGQGGQQVMIIDPAQLNTNSDADITPANASSPTASQKSNQVSEPQQRKAGVIEQIDVLVLVTPQLNQAESNSPENLALHYVDVANSALDFGDSEAVLNLVGVEVHNSSTSNEGTAIENALFAIQQSESVTALRDSHVADLVVLLRNGTTSTYCGYGFYLQPVQNADPQTEANNKQHLGYSVVEVEPGYCPDDTFAHEIGHNLGCDHDREEVNNFGTHFGTFDYSYGYHIRNSFRTVMSYCYSCGAELLAFSTPDKSYQGIPLGRPESGTQPANNAKTIFETAEIVSKYRVAAKPNDPVDPKDPVPAPNDDPDPNDDGVKGGTGDGSDGDGPKTPGDDPSDDGTSPSAQP